MFTVRSGTAPMRCPTWRRPSKIVSLLLRTKTTPLSPSPLSPADSEPHTLNTLTFYINHLPLFSNSSYSSFPPLSLPLSLPPSSLLPLSPSLPSSFSPLPSFSLPLFFLPSSSLSPFLPLSSETTFRSRLLHRPSSKASRITSLQPLALS